MSGLSGSDGQTMPYKDWADLDLLVALRQGASEAFETLAERYGPKIYRLAFCVIRNRADAQEVLQDVLLTLARRGESFEGRSSLWRWIYRITTNAALCKRRGKRHAVETSLEGLLGTFHPDGHRVGDSARLLTDQSQSPAEDLLSGERRRALERAIEGLPEHYRAVLVMRHVEGLSTESVAKVFDESVASVKSRLHRARTALREQLPQALA